jgi:hypothetical protein
MRHPLPSSTAARRPVRAPRTTQRRRGMTPLGALARGVVAGAVGTAAMDALLFARYRRGGGKDGFAAWESSAGLDSWDDAPAPAQVGKRLVEGLFARELAPERARLVNNATHWAFGLFGGVQYGLVAASLKAPRVRDGLPFGTCVWVGGYVVLPAAKLYKPIWEYDPVTLAKDLSAHLVYGLGAAAAFQLLAGGSNLTSGKEQ